MAIVQALAATNNTLHAAHPPAKYATTKKNGKQETPPIRSKAVALGRLLVLGRAEFRAFMDSLLIQHTRELSAFAGFWHYKYWEDAFQKAGFEVTSSEGKSAVEMIRKEHAPYDRSDAISSSLSRMHLIPRKLDTMLQRMNRNRASYIEAEEEELLTLNWKYVTQEPQRSES